MGRTSSAARAVAVCCLVVLGACGGGGSSGGTVDVRLTDYDVILAETSVGAGTVELVIENAGGFVHELLVVRSDLAIDELPKTPDGLFDEQAAGVTVVASALDLAAGVTTTITDELDAGGYYLICNRPAEPDDPLSHLGHGMLAPFRVT